GPAFYRCGGRHVGQLLERLDECRPAVGIAGIVDGVHADVQVLRVQRLRIAEGQPEQHGVARGNVRDGNATADAVLGNLEIAGQRGTADGAQGQRHDLERRTEHTRTALSRPGPATVALPVTHRQL